VSALAPTLQAFFTERLIGQRHASPNTIAAYRDTLRLLLAFAAERLGRQPCELHLGDLDADLIAAFLTHLETERGNSVKTRNARLAAIHSLYRYAALRHPEHAHDIQRVLSIPPKRSHRALVTFLEQAEIDALLAAPDRSTWAIQTGLRASELTGLNCGDVHLATGAHISCTGKGRKQRITPLTTSPSPSCASGSPSEPDNPTVHHSRRCAADDSAVTDSNADSPNTSAQHRAAAQASSRRPSPCTPSGTPPRCNCCTPASTPLLSPRG